MKTEIDIKTADGTAKAGLFAPESGKANGSGVIFYMDAVGPRAALDAMAERLAAEGYFVVLPDLFYRFGPYGPFDRTAFADETTRNQIMGMIHGTTQAMTASDSAAFLDVLTEAGATGKIGAVGYCLGGGRALTAAATYSDRVVVAASFHGGNLASGAPDSPHLRAPEIKARVYVGVAGVDGSFPPEQSARLAEALRTAEVDHTIENYVGVQHGWTIPGSDVYDKAGSERHWKRLLTLLDETLK